MSEQEQLNYINKECNTKYTSLNNVDWTNISFTQRLSEEFIREFQDRLDWHWISEFQKLSESFIREFKDKIDWDSLFNNKHFRQSIINHFNQ